MRPASRRDGCGGIRAGGLRRRSSRDAGAAVGPAMGPAQARTGRRLLADTSTARSKSLAPASMLVAACTSPTPVAGFARSRTGVFAGLTVRAAEKSSDWRLVAQRMDRVECVRRSILVRAALSSLSAAPCSGGHYRWRNLGCRRRRPSPLIGSGSGSGIRRRSLASTGSLGASASDGNDAASSATACAKVSPSFVASSKNPAPTSHRHSLGRPRRSAHGAREQRDHLTHAAGKRVQQLRRFADALCRASGVLGIGDFADGAVERIAQRLLRPAARAARRRCPECARSRRRSGVGCRACGEYGIDPLDCRRDLVEVAGGRLARGGLAANGRLDARNGADQRVACRQCDCARRIRPETGGRVPSPSSRRRRHRNPPRPAARPINPAAPMVRWASSYQGGRLNSTTGERRNPPVNAGPRYPQARAGGAEVGQPHRSIDPGAGELHDRAPSLRLVGKELSEIVRRAELGDGGEFRKLSPARRAISGRR